MLLVIPVQVAQGPDDIVEGKMTGSSRSSLTFPGSCLRNVYRWPGHKYGPQLHNHSSPASSLNSDIEQPFSYNQTPLPVENH